MHRQGQKEFKKEGKIMCWNGHKNHVEILFEVHFEVFRDGKRKEEIISRREKSHEQKDK